MAPEQLNDAKSVGPAADVFALGAILYEALTGQEAFPGDSDHSRVVAILEGRFAPVRSERPEVPRWLAQIVERAVSPKSEARFADGSALAAALEAGGGGGRRRLVVPGLVAVAAIGIMVAVLAVSRHANEPAPAPTPPPVPAPAPAPAAPKAPPLPESARALQTTRTLRLAAVLGDAPWKHPDGPGGVAFLPDGHSFVAVSGERLLFFDLETGRVSRTFPIPVGPRGPMSIDVSPNGRRLLVTSHQPLSVIFDLASGREVARFTEQLNQIYSGRFVDDARVVTGGDDGSVRVWDAASGRQLWSQRAHDCVFACAASADGRLVATGGMDEQDEGAWEVERPPFVGPPRKGDFGVKIWGGATGTLKGKLVGSRKLVNCLAFSPDGERVAAGNWDCTVRVWDVKTGALLRTLQGHTDPISRVCFASRSRVVSAGGGHDLTLRIWDLERPAGGENVATFSEHRSVVTGLAASADGKRMLSIGADGTVRLWDLEKKKAISEVTGHCGAIVGAATSPDGRLAVTAGRDGTVRVWDVRTSRETRLLDPAAGPATGLVLDPDDGRAISSHEGDATIHQGGTIEVWNTTSGARRTLARFEGPVAALAARRSRAIAASHDGSLRIWDLAREGEPRAIEGVANPVALSLAEKGDRALLAGTETLILRDLDGPEILRYSKMRVAAAVLSSDGYRALVATDADVPTNEALVIHDFPAQTTIRQQSAIAVAADAAFRLGASAGRDGVVRIWDLAGRREIDRFEPGDLGRPTSLAFCGERLVVGTALGVTLIFEPGH
jgi:WD40 repeat protein